MKSDNIKKTIGNRINSLLAEKDKTQKALANELGVKPNVISYFCKGERTPNTEQIVKISRFFNVSADYLLGISGNFTTDDKLQFVCNYTGLNEKSIATIKSMKNFGSICYENTEVSGEKVFKALDQYLSDVICEKVSVYLADMKRINVDYLLHCLIKCIYKEDRHRYDVKGEIPLNMACFDHKKLSNDIKEKSEKCDMSYFRASKAYENYLKQYVCNAIGEYYDIKDIYKRLYDTFGYTKEQVDEKIKEIWKKYDEVGYKQWQQ
ncbi:MAG: helix-turn-helix domain-containing protein [Oscillospiraceae bacterium]